LSENRKRAKRIALQALRALGLFALARRLSRRRLRILCYHGFSIGDQHAYSPVMFMRPEIFEGRLLLLKRLGYPILTLENAIFKLQTGAIRRNEVVITIDDGWKTTLTLAAPLLAKHSLPACLYLTTYYAERDAEVFNVVVRYMLRKTCCTHISLRNLSPQIDGDYAIPGNEEALAARWIQFGEAQLSWPQRQELLRTLARCLDLDFEQVQEGRRFALLTPSDIPKLRELGVDIELHTHRHRLPDGDFEAAAREIEENRAALERLGGGFATHFCYPSGEYSAHHPEWLAQLGIVSATTCDPGSNTSRASPFLLRRYMDRDDANDIEFEAELCGFADFLRMLRGAISARPETPQ
jgi:peptidoglycan/xylan/chitin deacetylase (PgdA/CDA1 family)